MATYLTDNEGKFIPATQRPDGTWRKARRIKDGYVPQEEVPLYESKGKQFAQRKSTLPPGMCPVEYAKKEREKVERTKGKKQENAHASKANNTIIGGNIQKKQNKSQTKTQQTPGMLMLPNTGITKASLSKTSKANSNSNTTKTSSSINSNEDVKQLANDLKTTLKMEPDEEQQDASKKLKKLRKKLREIETIEQRIKSGELKKPEKDQLDKVKRKKEIMKEIKQLDEEELSPERSRETD